MSTSRTEIGSEDERYPESLRHLPDGPERLYVIGDPAALVPGLAVVGARRATPYGARLAERLAAWAADAGYVVISGGAIGCDQAAHRGALSVGGTTVAVMGCGADVAYPRGARVLLGEVAAHGAVISECPWGSQPKKWLFPRRNRLIAALCRVLLVVEASVPSGTFSTVDFALALGRTVAAVPGSVFSDGSRGPNRLIRQGAEVITEPDDLAALLAAELGPPPRQAGRLFGIDSSHSADSLLAAVLADPMRPDDIARAFGLDIVTVVRRLGSLEAGGRIARYPDGRYGPC